MRRYVLVSVIAASAALLVLAGVIAGVLIAGDGDDLPSTTATTTAGDTRAYLGLTVTVDGPRGLRVSSVETGGPAAAAGVQAGDVLRSIDGLVVRTPEQLRSTIEAKKPGDEVSITYERAGRETQARVKLGATTASAPIEATPTPRPAGQQPAPTTSRGRLGAVVAEINPPLIQRFNLNRISGIVITEVVAGGAAASAGLQPGDVILVFGSTVVATPEELQRTVLAAPVNEAVDLRIARGSEEMALRVVLPPQSTLDELGALLPPALRERLQRQLDAGTLPPEQLQQLLRLYQARGENVRIGTVRSVTADALVIAPDGGGDEVSVSLHNSTFTGKAAIRRGAAAIEAADLRVGETVLVLSIDGGISALSIYAFGVLPP